MKLGLILSTLAVLQIDGRTIRGAKRGKRKRGIAGTLRRCYPSFTEYEECLMDMEECEDLRDEYFECLYAYDEGDAYLDGCDLSLTSSTTKTTDGKRSTLNSASNVTSSSFGTEMFVELCKANPSSNVLFSPLSGELYFAYKY